MLTLDDAADDLDAALIDYRTGWLADLVRRGEGEEVVRSLEDLCGQVCRVLAQHKELTHGTSTDLQ